MTKVKAKPKARESKKSEIFIVRSGSHSRKEKGIVVKYECGDEIELSAAELEKFPLKFMSLAEYDSFLLAEEVRRRADKALDSAQFPPKVLKRGKRSAEALKRQRKLVKARRRSERRTLV